MPLDSLPHSAIPRSADWAHGNLELFDFSVICGSGGPGRTVWLDALQPDEIGHRWRGPVSALEMLVDWERPPLPAGLIFHTGRCGSTLLANILAADTSVRMISEPEILSDLIRHQGIAAAAQSGQLIGLLLAAFGRGLNAVPPRAADGTGARVIVKTSNWNAIAARRITSAVPGVPAVFVWRPAAEVVASCLLTQPPWSGNMKLRAQLAGQVAALRGIDDPEMRPAELFARVWSATARAVLDLVTAAAGRVGILGYHDLRADPARIAADVMNFFLLRGTAAPADALARIARTYSKDFSGNAVFDPRGAHSRPPLDPSDHALVTRLTAEVEEEIRLSPALTHHR